MRLTIQQFSPKGFYDKEHVVEARTVKEALAKVIPTIEKSPDTLEGVKQIDWTEIHIRIYRR